MTEEVRPELVWGDQQGINSEKAGGMDERLSIRESVLARRNRLEREARDAAKLARGQRRIEIYGDEIGGALHEILDPDIDLLETDTGRDVDRKGLLVEALDNALQSGDSAERHQALRLIVDTIESVQTHRHREFRMR